MNIKKQTIAKLAIIAVITSMFAAGAAAKISGQAQITSVSGTVEAQYNGKGEWAPIKAGSFIKAGDKIRTGAKSTCSLKWNKGNTLDMGPLTTASFDTLEKDPATETENSTIKLASGNISFAAKKLPTKKSTYEISAPSAVAGIRGTKGKVETDENGNTKIKCDEGLISVKSITGEGEVLLAAGQKTEVEKDKNPKQPTGEKEKDKTPPALSVFQPAASFTLDSNGCSIVSGAIQCAVTGMTEPGARLTINGQQCMVAIDGSFSCSTLPMPVTQSTILVQAYDEAGNISAATLTNTVDLTRIYSLTVTLSPSSIVADGQNTTTVTVKTYNIMGNPVGGTVTLTAANASSPAASGYLTSSTVTTSSAGTGTTTYNGGLCFTANTATITATAGGIASGAATLTLTPAVPPSPGQ